MPDFLSGAGAMGEYIRAFDWKGTPLGPIERWPQSLRTSVGLILTSRHPMWIGWGPEMTFLYNDAYLHVLGPAKHPSALGRPAAEVWAEIWDICGPLAEKVFAKGEASFVDDVRLFMERGGFLEETFYSFSYSPIRDESGRVSGLFCPSTDVTPKVLNTRRLKTLSELAANALIEKTTAGAAAITAGTFSRNPDDIPFALLYLANEGKTQATLEQVVGHFDNSAAIPPSVDLENGRDTSIWRVGEVFRSGQGNVVNVRELPGLPLGAARQHVSEAAVLPLTSRGEERPYGVLVAGVNPCRRLDQDYSTFFELLAGQVATAIQNARAVEQEKKRADTLAELDRAKTVFFSNVSHEFRTPLTLMLGPIENLISNAEGLGPEDRQDLLIAHRNSLRLLRLVNSLLDFSRIESGRVKAAFVPMDLSRLTADLASNFESLLDAAGLTLTVECAALSENVYVDIEMWEKIVLNLLSNAFKFTFEGGVTVHMSEEDRHAVLTVSDTGIGIAESELPRIFERFHRIEGAKGRTYEGSGIGLALIQELVKQHGGTVTAASRPGSGTSFTIRVPFGKAHLPADRIHEDRPLTGVSGRAAQSFTEEALTWVAQAPDETNPTSPAAREGVRRRVLVADDNADMREHIKRALGDAYEVLAAKDGNEALEIVRRERPDLLLTDIMMPRMDGFELLRAIRTDEATATLPVIFLSARAGEEKRVEGLGAGADDYLVKPFTAAELRARVGTHLEMAVARWQAAEREMALRAEAEAARDEVIHVLESITDGFMALDREWRITYLNAEAEKLIGMRREQLLGRNHWEVFPASVGTSLYREFVRAAADRQFVEFENFYAPWKRWFHIKVYPGSDGGLSVFYEDISPRKVAEEQRAALLIREREARQEAEILNEVSRQLAGELELEKLVQSVTDAATRLTGAEFGALFYNVLDDQGGSYLLYTLSGSRREDFEKIGLPRNTPLFDATFRGTANVRCDDVLEHPLYGKNPPHNGMPNDHLPVRSYLAVPVVSRSGEVLGGLFFGHSKTGIFTERAERVAAGIASHAAIAIDNARLFAKAEHELARRTEVERALRDSEQRFRNMIDALPAAVYTTDAEGRLTHYNPAAVALSGRTPQLGVDRWCVTWKLYSSDGVPMGHAECLMADALRDGQPRRGIECIAERPDGTRVWFTPYPTPLLDSEGRVTGGINMMVDITARKAAEEALRRSEERFRGVFESSAVGVAILSLDTRFLQANRALCSTLGYSESELEQLECGALIHPDDCAHGEALAARLKSGEIPSFMVEQRYITKGGHTIWIQSSVSAMRDAMGKPEHLIGLYEDVTTRREAEDALKVSEERFRAIVDTTPECVKMVARDGTLLYMNQSGLCMIGAEYAAEAVGKCIYDVIAPEFRQEFQEFNERVCSGEKGILEFEIVTLKGQRRSMQTHAAPLSRPDGEIAHVAITHDITERKRAESAMLLLGAIVDSSDDAIVSKDLTGIITSWNRGAERLFGYSAAEVIGKSITILIPEDRLSEEPKILGRLQRGERVDHFETIRRRKDGRLLDISLTISPIKDASGKVIGASKIARDITERKRSEAAIQALNERLQSELAATIRMQQLSTRLVQAEGFPVLLDEVVDAGMEITHADMGNIQLLEGETLRIVSQRGFDRPFLDFFNEVRHGTAACGAALASLDRVIVENVEESPIFIGSKALEVMLSAGARAVQSTPLVSRSGKALGMFSTHYRSPRRPTESELRMLDVLARQAADLIERKLAETALLDSEARFRQLADSMPQIVWTARPDGAFDYYNERWYQFTGFDRNAIGDPSWERILHPEDLGRCRDEWHESVRSGHPYRIEYRFWDREEKRWRWFMGRALPVRNAAGEVMKWFGTSTDIDEQKRVEDELRRANQDLEQFAYSASHDLQEPLRGIRIYSQLLAKKYLASLDGEAREFLEYLMESAVRMEMLVRDLLAYTQVTKLEAADEEVDASAALRDALANLEGSIKEAGAQVTSDPLPRLRVHDTHLRQLFQNLVGNAIKYRRRDTTPIAHIGVERRGGSWLFSVEDNGIGIEPQYRERIFGLFKRLHSGEEYSGTGIGLAICQRIVERYHGRIWVESEPGQGSVFKFTLPE